MISSWQDTSGRWGYSWHLRFSWKRGDQTTSELQRPKNLQGVPSSCYWAKPLSGNPSIGLRWSQSPCSQAKSPLRPRASLCDWQRSVFFYISSRYKVNNTVKNPVNYNQVGFVDLLFYRTAFKPSEAWDLVFRTLGGRRPGWAPCFPNGVLRVNEPGLEKFLHNKVYKSDFCRIST